MVGIYALLGCSKQNLSYWHSNPNSPSSAYKKTKISVVQKAQKLFSLLDGQAEQLANRAGLSLGQACRFSLSEVLSRFHINNSLIHQRASLTERMLSYYKNGKHVTKESLLAVAVSLELTVEETDMLLRGYGFCLSRSIAADAIVSWFLKGDRNMRDVDHINYVLYELGLPLLGTREKRDIS